MTADHRCLLASTVRVQTMPIPAFTPRATIASIRSAMTMHCVQRAGDRDRLTGRPPHQPGQRGRPSLPRAREATAACVTIACIKAKTAAGRTHAPQQSNSPSAASSRPCQSHVEDAQPARATGPGCVLQPGPRSSRNRQGKRAPPWCATGRKRGCPL